MGRTIVECLWKTPLCVLAYMVGVMAAGAAAGPLGLTLPAIPPSGNEGMVFAGLLIGCTLLALSLAPLAHGLRVGGVARWLMLAAFAYVCLGVNTAIEAGIFTTFGGTAAMALLPLLPCLLLALVAATLFRLRESRAFGTTVRTHAAGMDGRQWAWRIVAAVIAFPVIYYVFGTPVGLLIGDYYRQEQFRLILPSIGVVIGAQLLRSTLYLLASLPIVVAWSGSRRGFALTFGAAFFVLTGLFGMVQAYWLPPQMRIIHSVEMFADAMAYAAALAMLFRASTANSPATSTAA
jgi:hypothetical protein